MATGNIAERLGEELEDSPQKANSTKLTRLLISGGTLALRELFDTIILPRDLTKKLKDPLVVATLEDLRSRKILTKDQWNILYPKPGVEVESKSFDITLLFKLLRNICGSIVRPANGWIVPANGWDNRPEDEDTSLEADLARIKHYRNIYAHANNLEISKKEFENQWSEIKGALLRIFNSIDATSTEECERKIDEWYGSSIAEGNDKDLMVLKMWYMEEEISKNTTILEEFDKQIKKLKETLEGRITPDTYPEMTIQTVIKLVSRGSWMVGSAYILNRYKDDPDTFLKMVKGFVLPTGVLVYAMTGGSIRLKIRVKTLDGLEDFWTRYQTGRLKEDLEYVLVKECGLEDLANDDDDVEVDVTVSEEEYKKAREILKGLQHSDEDGHEDPHSRYDKDDPAKSTDAATQDPDGTMDEPRREKSTDAANQDPDGKMDDPRREKTTDAANQDPDGKMDDLKREKTTDAANQDPDKKMEPQSPTLKIVHGKQFKDGESIFQIHLAFVTSPDQANQALKKLEKKSSISDASYRIQASRIFNKERKSFIENCDDYGTTNAGARLLRLLEMADARNVVVILTCWREGVLQEPRGSLISQRTLDLLYSLELFKFKKPSKENVMKEVEDFFELIKQHVAHRHPPIKSEQESPKIEISHGRTVEDRQNVFQAHLAKISSQDQVEKVLAEMKKDLQVAKATYNAYAYRILEENETLIEDFDDDGENFAGASLLHLLQKTNAKDVMVIVTRWHSRIALGHTRFKYINKTALKLLQEADLVKLTPTDAQKLLKEQEEYLEHMKEQGAPPSRAIEQEKINIVHGEKVEDRKSFFQAHLAVISSSDQVDKVFKQLKKDKDIANATYNTQAYRIFDKDRCSMVQDCDDDGEYLGGASLLHLLQVLDVQNVMIFVSRWHGEIKLGRDRFKHIHQCALKLLQSEGLVETLMPEQEQEVLSQLDKYFDFVKRNAMDYDKEIPKSSCPKILHGCCIEDRKSVFQAHLAVVTSRDEVDQVLAEVKKNRFVAKATYNILAYRIIDKENGAYMEDFDDGGETGAGEKLLHQLQQAGAKNVVAVVTRWHGDILLGSSRFRHINECASDLLESSPLVS